MASRVLDAPLRAGAGLRHLRRLHGRRRTGSRDTQERDAALVTERRRSPGRRSFYSGRPYFLWRAPTTMLMRRTCRQVTGRARPPPVGTRERSPTSTGRSRRLLAGLPGPGQRIVAAVGDHGEMLGEHGEKEHGVFLYQGALAVPPDAGGTGRSLGAWSTARPRRGAWRRRFSRSPASALRPGRSARSCPACGHPRCRPSAVYSESDMPASAYGWSPLAAATDGRYRLVVAPRPELYDLEADPSESRNLWGAPERAETAETAPARHRRCEPGRAETDAPADAAELAGSPPAARLPLRLERPRPRSIDPKDGIRLLDEFEDERPDRSGRAAEAIAALTVLVKASPGDVPFLVRLAEAQAAAGEVGAAIETVGDALTLNPGLRLPAPAARPPADASRTGSEEARASYVRRSRSTRVSLRPGWVRRARREERRNVRGGSPPREAEAEKFRRGALVRPPRPGGARRRRNGCRGDARSRGDAPPSRLPGHVVGRRRSRGKQGRPALALGRVRESAGARSRGSSRPHVKVGRS